MAFAAEELRLARPLQERLLGADIDPKLLTVIGKLFHTLHHEQLDPLSDYPEFAHIVATASYPTHETPDDGNKVLYLFIKEYHPVPHEQPGQHLAADRGGTERFFPIRSTPYTHMFPWHMEIFADQMALQGRQPAWVGLDGYLDMFFWRKTAITVTNVAVVRENGQLKIGFLPLFDITKPLTHNFVIYLEREFRRRADIHSGVFISSSKRRGYFMSTDRLFSRNRLLNVIAAAGLINHVEESGIADEYFVDERHIWHMLEHWPNPHLGIRIIPALPIKPTIPRITAITNYGQIEFLSDEPPSLLGRELLGAGLI